MICPFDTSQDCEEFWDEEAPDCTECPIYLTLVGDDDL